MKSSHHLRKNNMKQVKQKSIVLEILVTCDVDNLDLNHYGPENIGGYRYIYSSIR